MGEHLDRAIALLDEIDGMAFGKVSAALDTMQVNLMQAKAEADRNRATIEALVGALERAKSAVNAAFEQAHAEYHDNWTKQDKCDALISAWRSQADAALLLARGSAGNE